MVDRERKFVETENYCLPTHFPEIIDSFSSVVSKYLP